MPSATHAEAEEPARAFIEGVAYHAQDAVLVGGDVVLGDPETAPQATAKAAVDGGGELEEVRVLGG